MTTANIKQQWATGQNRIDSDSKYTFTQDQLNVADDFEIEESTIEVLHDSEKNCWQVNFDHCLDVIYPKANYAKAFRSDWMDENPTDDQVRAMINDSRFDLAKIVRRTW